jgi:hypothetical protein
MNKYFYSRELSSGDEMGLPRFLKFIGLAALVAGIIAFLLPSEFIYSPIMSEFLTKFGDALFKGISSNPMVKLLIAKAPAILLAGAGFALVFWGCIKDLTEPDASGPCAKPPALDLAAATEKETGKRPEYGKSVRELGGPRKP